MAQFEDQAGYPISLPAAPQRIVSLVPSQTELLADLGLEKQVTGITKFCVRPPQWRAVKAIVGGTKQVKHQVIDELAPDLILANKEENEKDQVVALRKKYPVWTSDIHNLADALDMINTIGMMTGTTEKASAMTKQIRESFSSLPEKYEPLTAAYLIWQKPYMTTGHDTFIHAMMQAAGFTNVFSKQTRYPETTVDELHRLQPDVVLLSSEPFPFSEKHARELAQLLPRSRCVLADGEMFSWYGSRLLKAPGYFERLRGEMGG